MEDKDYGGLTSAEVQKRIDKDRSIHQIVIFQKQRLKSFVVIHSHILTS